jgi:DNA-binding MarR family transcriptional regulator
MNATVTLVRGVAKLLEDYADALEAVPLAPRVQDLESPADDLFSLTYLGRRQKEILAVLREAGWEGAQAAKIATRIKYDEPNVWLTLKSLVDRGLVVKLVDQHPYRYRLADRFLPSVDSSTG